MSGTLLEGPDGSHRRREVMAKEKVWVADSQAGFVLGRIVDLLEEGVQVSCGSQDVSVSFDHVYPADEDEHKDVDDNCSLMYLNEATLLNNIRIRYERNKIYTYVANILVAINPYYDIPNLYSQDTIRAYQGKSLGTMPPHVFAIADKAFRDMKVTRLSQSITVSGESGAGKTESTKYILKYLCDCYGTHAGPLEKKLLNANPILEAFGNAKTTRNNNSSRFGKFIEIHFDAKCQVAGGFISHYLLERARVVSQSADERNYHIFYQLCAGAPEQLRQRLQLGSPDEFRYLNQGCTRYFCTVQTNSKMPDQRKSQAHLLQGFLTDPIIDDCSNFEALHNDLKNVGLTEDECEAVYTTIAAVLHLGNIQFEEDPDDNKGGCRVTAQSESSLRLTSHLMGLDQEELRRSLTARMMQTNAAQSLNESVIMVPLKTHEAANARDALAKTVYSRLFDYIVMKINQSIPFEKSSYYIGILDIAGFEYFTVNSFEQFCINYCNEKLQQFFNQRILKDEQDLYEKEGLGVKKITFVDNQDCIDLIEAKPDGIFSLLDEESKLPKPNAQHFTAAVHSSNQAHFRLALPRKSKLREHREIRDVDGFMIRHFAGAVCYETANFIEKNNDALHSSLEAVVHDCQNTFISQLFVGQAGEQQQQRGKLTFISVGNKFKRQLGQLMQKLSSTGTNFIRCIKPNLKMVAHHFEGASILSQLQCAGMTSVLELMQQGYPSRTQFSQLYAMYKEYLPPQLARLDPRLFCKSLFRALGLDHSDYKFGLTKAFFRPGKFAEFDQMLRSDPDHLRLLVAKVTRWLLCSRWKKAQWCAWSVIKLKNKIIYRRQALVILQKSTRMYLARRQHRPRYLGMIRLKALQSSISQIGQMAASLKADKEAVLANVQMIHQQLDAAMARIKAQPGIPRADVEALYNGLVEVIERQLSDVKVMIERQTVQEEQERLRKLQLEMEMERQRKQQEQLRMQQDQERQQQLATDRLKKAQMEERRKREEALIIQMENDRVEAALIQQKLNEENQRLRQQLEQERRDHELALRLATENNSVLVEETAINPQPPSQVRSVSSTTSGSSGSSMLSPVAPAQVPMATASFSKFDLSKWKYAELRDTINTSCDIELLEACREEFHRRLKVYHAWKAKNRKKNGGGSLVNSHIRAPNTILMESSSNQHFCHTLLHNNHDSRPVQSQEHRFFRIPFVRPASGGIESGLDVSAAVLSPGGGLQKGWWYAHFQGEWIARQMELHPDREPVLLVAGRDDMQMCELALHETGLTQKRGAEILDHEFEREWVKHGGQPYIRTTGIKSRH